MGERLLLLPDAASLDQLVSAEEWALLCERCPTVLLFFVRKESLILPSHQYIRLFCGFTVHLLCELTCCDRVFENKTQEPAWISKKKKKIKSSFTLILPYFAYPGRI